ncbi:MAG TPA: hypothetical protein VMK12_27245 [Anaeromyxobacteraceae bacterium]|nr:hypothetical protein [Anaeromyxobacteraceae bacterium]
MAAKYTEAQFHEDVRRICEPNISKEPLRPLTDEEMGRICRETALAGGIPEHHVCAPAAKPEKMKPRDWRLYFEWMAKANTKRAEAFDAEAQAADVDPQPSATLTAEFYRNQAAACRTTAGDYAQMARDEERRHG